MNQKNQNYQIENTQYHESDSPELAAEVAAIDANENPNTEDKLRSQTYHMSQTINDCLQNTRVIFDDDETNRTMDNLFVVSGFINHEDGRVSVQAATIGRGMDIASTIHKALSDRPDMQNVIINAASYILKDEGIDLEQIIERNRFVNEHTTSEINVPEFEDHRAEIDFYLDGLKNAIDRRRGEQIEKLEAEGKNKNEIGNKYQCDSVLVIGLRAFDFGEEGQSCELFGTLSGVGKHLSKSINLMLDQDQDYEKVFDNAMQRRAFNKLPKHLRDSLNALRENIDKVENIDFGSGESEGATFVNEEGKETIKDEQQQG